MRVTIKIKRFNPEKDSKPHWHKYQVEAEPTDRLLDALNYIKWNIDGTLTYRRSCAHGVCGSDAMLINQRNGLACRLLLKNLGNTITVEPLRGLPLLKDLLVDMEGFLAKYRAVKPYLMTNYPGTRKRTAAVARGARSLRRHDKVHPLCRLQHVLPVVLVE